MPLDIDSIPPKAMVLLKLRSSSQVSFILLAQRSIGLLLEDLD